MTRKPLDVMPCPKCGASLAPAGPTPVLCLECGWVPLAEIERQLTYWSERREKALLDQALGPSPRRQQPP